MAEAAQEWREDTVNVLGTGLIVVKGGAGRPLAGLAGAAAGGGRRRLNLRRSGFGRRLPPPADAFNSLSRALNPLSRAHRIPYPRYGRCRSHTAHAVPLAPVPIAKPLVWVKFTKLAGLATVGAHAVGLDAAPFPLVVLVPVPSEFTL